MSIGSGHAIDLRLTCQRFRHTCAADAVACAVLIVNEERSTSVTETFFRLFSAHFTVRAWFLPPVHASPAPWASALKLQHLQTLH